ncbi:methyltransferase domain-containing protein [Bacillus sp. 31A1R]|uniref:Methyltransferase domain-containing protein n=1 Tax=Robertmurraya mangrovi TaxID=3098077 RepID=A0ABU5IVT5_9BACI|nr:methyltransferase domain-containing protein [Bacillus sp. 31A1R]MDZ5471264.1 methyltransferase domain-containing protein [Bacillus sp. 31A1R]
MTGHRFKPEKADKLIDPKRKELFTPESVIELLNIKGSDLVADLGAGNGYLTLPIAKETQGTVYAVDIEPQMLDLLKERANNEGITNIQYTVSNLENIDLPDDSIDKAVVAFVLHEVSDLKKVLSEFKRILTSGSKLLVLEWEAIETEIGPPLEERIPSDGLHQIFMENELVSQVIDVHQAIYGIIVEF